MAGRTTIVRPERLQVAVDEEGNRLLVGTFSDGDEVVLVMAETAAKEIGRALMSATLTIADSLPGL